MVTRLRTQYSSRLENRLLSSKTVITVVLVAGKNCDNNIRRKTPVSQGVQFDLQEV